LDLARLEYDIAIAQQNWQPDAAQMLKDFERAGIQPLGERILEQIRCEWRQACIAVVLNAKALQGTEIVDIAELGAKRFIDAPIAIAPLDTEFDFEPVREVFQEAIVVDKRVVDIDQEHDRGRRSGR